MKFQIKNILAIMALATALASCSRDDNNEVTPNTFGEAELYFDNGFNGDALLPGVAYTNSNGENLTINRLNYIISNIVFIDENGGEFAYPKERSYFIISQETQTYAIDLAQIPAGNYKQVRFGLGVDNERYLQGETAQQSFWDLAAQNNMTWTWSTGYRFINMEGTFTSLQSTEPKVFQVHQGSNTATDNYREITLNLPTTARVRSGEKPSIHIKTDVNVLLDGAAKIKLQDNLNQAGTAASIMGGQNLIAIAGNSTAMFAVDHVHNGSGTHH